MLKCVLIFKMRIALLIASLLFCALARGDLIVIKKDNINDASIANVKIIYNGSVNAGNISQLMASLDEINLNYPSLKKIYLYINSDGGDMDSGYIAYEAIRSSKIPIVTVNTSMIASSATLIYCAAKERLAMYDTLFVLHPSSYSVNSMELKPDTIARIKDDNDKYNNMFDRIYKKCTNYTDEERRYFPATLSVCLCLQARQ
uniref:ATP-dependent Clp protease proteolytic subunit n=1 Tax=Scandinavium goeteborgense TaxID=1851514 RepID=UPI001358F535|nr:ATP-dependent Clp protease proteolytic subunit [Scandinavium goeteborgense]